MILSRTCILIHAKKYPMSGLLESTWTDDQILKSSRLVLNQNQASTSYVPNQFPTSTHFKSWPKLKFKIRLKLDLIRPWSRLRILLALTASLYRIPKRRRRHCRVLSQSNKYNNQMCLRGRFQCLPKILKKEIQWI